MPDHLQDHEDFVQALTRAEAGLRLHGLDDGLDVLRSLWERHIGEAEEHVFRPLVEEKPASDGLVGFFLSEHADLSTRLASLTEAPPSSERAQATIRLIHRVIQHVFLEARVLSSPGAAGVNAGTDAPVRSV